MKIQLRCWSSTKRTSSQAKKKNMCVYCHMSKKSRVGRSALIFFELSAKPEIVVPSSGIWYFIFEISGKPSFVETVLWRVTQFFYLLCSQFRQKASSWINKTLLLIKQQKSHPITGYLDNRCYRELRPYLCHMEWQVAISLTFFFHFIYFLDFKFMSDLLHYK